MNESTLVPREEMSDLDWLARNVHEWKDGCKFVYVLRSAQGVFAMWLYDKDSVCQRNTFTRDQWLARRAELQNKPSWKDAPEWANFLSQGFSGAWFWHEFKPEIGDCGYFSVKGKYTINITGEALGDWRDTLEKRPAEHKHSSRLSPEGVDKIESIMQRNDDEFVPFVSVEDANPRFPRDVDYVGKINAATAKQPAPKGTGSPILGMVLADLTNRALEGKEKYGEPLLANNGRNPLWDAYQEALDLAMYLRQAIEEQK